MCFVLGMYWYRCPIPPVSLYEKARWYKKLNRKFIPPQMANKGLQAELSWILLQTLQKHWLCSRIPLHSGMCRATAAQVSCCKQDTTRYKALDSQINSKLQNGPVFFLLHCFLPKGPNLHSLSSHCSCFKALPCTSNLLWSQEELADLNRGLSHYSSAQLAVAVRHVISSTAHPG